jgi:2'-hydroxyisoflavone reductase
MDRRDFIKRSFMASAASVCSPLFSTCALADASPKRILVLGGTRFLGPALVEAAIAEGHTVTLFNRGVTNPDMFPNLQKLRGFRSRNPGDEDMSVLARRHFDVAVDIWPSDPALAASAAELLKDRVGQYLYVSSVAAYDSKELVKAGIDENAPLEPWDGPGREYNRGKAESERRLHAILGENVTIVRPGPIKGDRDLTPDLFTWLKRAQHGGQHIGPGDGSDPVELVDVKDVARFLMLAINRSLQGTFNLTGRPMSFREFLDACNASVRSNAQFVWMPQDFLHQQGLETDFALGLHAGNFPFWRPAGAKPGLEEISSDKAFRAGWRTRAFQETALDCLAYFRSLDERFTWDDYLSANKEKQVLDSWEHRSSS